MPVAWHSDCTATATPEEEPSVIMRAPSFSIMRLAAARAASDLVCVSPETYSTFLPRMPLPLRTQPLKVFSMPTSPSSLRRSDEHTSELQSLMRISYAVLCLIYIIIYNISYSTVKYYNLQTIQKVN